MLYGKKGEVYFDKKKKVYQLKVIAKNFLCNRYCKELFNRTFYFACLENRVWQISKLRKDELSVVVVVAQFV